MPSLPDPKVLRLPRTDVDSDFVLINIEQFGSDLLDLKLVGTDGSSPFVTHLRQNQIHKLQASTSQTDSGHWQSILSAVLLQSIPNDPTLTGVEAVANVSSSQLTITIRNKISGITVPSHHNSFTRLYTDIRSNDLAQSLLTRMTTKMFSYTTGRALR
jgi:hypothetical protein